MWFLKKGILIHVFERLPYMVTFDNMAHVYIAFDKRDQGPSAEIVQYVDYIWPQSRHSDS